MFRSSFDVRFSVMVQFWCLGSNSVDSGQLSRRHKLWYKIMTRILILVFFIIIYLFIFIATPNLL
ncbi:hypothetical protein HanXRQr2_Chr16g0738951 [Helianthus annuus]|uniref:Uncharacterized protein n=1 Tax=Helianthus annuus TaxID=4232 RepID=A0A9K3DPL0_HELAN|nr:hypothetical protein HanXRQr2_Chr16g0738951 [Helianthus annuus]